jgi:chromosome segregation ATPase
MGAMEDGPATTLEHLDQQLSWTRSELEQYQRLGDQLESGRRQLAALRGRITKLEARVARERQDVDDLQGANLAALLARVRGEYEQREEKELAEWLAACLRLDQGREEHAALTAQIEALTNRVASLADPLPRYHELLAEKGRWIREHGAEDDDQHRLHLAEREGVLKDLLREVDEAVWAGQVAKASITGLLNSLSKAQALGKLDMIGLASNWVKFEHIDDAHRHASAANRALSRFQMELADVQARHEAFLALELGQLATFADYFFDDLVSDWIVQCRINRSHASAGIARTRVNRTLQVLTRRRHDVMVELRLVAERAEGIGQG